MTSGKSVFHPALRIGKRWGMAAAACLVMTVFLATGGASAQDAGLKPVLDRLDRIENELTDLQKQIFRGAPTAAGAAPITVPADADTPKAFAARIEVRVQALERSIRQLTGQVERFDFDLRAAGRRIDELVADVDRRLRDLEVRLGASVVVGGESGADTSVDVSLAPPAEQTLPAQSTNRSTTSDLSAAAPVVVGAAPTPRALEVDTSSEQDRAPAAKPRALGQLSGEDIKQLEAARAAGGTAIGTTAAGVSVSVPSAAPASQASTPSTPSASAQTGTASAPQIAAVPQASSQQLYRSAFSLLTKQDFEGAEVAFRSFIDRHGDDPLAGNAVYWLGETFYARRRFADAAVTFADGYQNYPGSTKTPDNLLKLGLSLARLDRSEDACFALARLLEEFPNADARLVARAKDERGKLGCGG